MAALDVAVAPALRQTLRRVLADRSAVIVTHDAMDALILADRVVVLEDGRVAEEGPASRGADPPAQRLLRPGSPVSTCSAAPGTVPSGTADGADGPRPGDRSRARGR